MKIEQDLVNVILVNLGLAQKNKVSIDDGREVFEAMNVSGDAFDVPGDDTESTLIGIDRSINVYC